MAPAHSFTLPAGSLAQRAESPATLPTGANVARMRWEAVLAELHGDCWSWALACCRRDAEAAEEVLQRAYLKILDQPERFTDRSSPRTYVFGVIRRTSQEEHRRLRVRHSRDAVLGDELIDRAASPDDAAAGNQRSTMLLRALERLSRRQREVLELVFYHDYTVEEAAAVMHVSIGSARTHYHRGKQRLKLLLPEDIV